jgi:hypothetical protein
MTLRRLSHLSPLSTGPITMTAISFTDNKNKIRQTECERTPFGISTVRIRNVVLQADHSPDYQQGIVASNVVTDEQT